MTFFGLKSRQDLEKRAAQPHQEFPEVPTPTPPDCSSCQIWYTNTNLGIQLNWTGKFAREVFQKSRGIDA